MNAIVINDLRGKINASVESFLIRLSYLLGEHACSAGTAYSIIDMKLFYEKMPWPVKVKVIEDEERHHDEESAREFIQLMDTYQMIKKVKNKPKPLIVAMKRTEKVIEENFSKICKQRFQQAEMTGLIQLEPVCRDPEFLYYVVDVTRPEREDEYYGAMSKLLMGDADVYRHSPELKPEPPIYLLSAEFFNDDFYKEVYAKEKNEETFLECCFTFPNVNFASAEELRNLRRQFTDTGKGWRMKMNEWIEKVAENKGSTESFFKQEVLPEVSAINDEIRTNVLMKHFSNLVKYEITAEVWIGALPVMLFWKFFRHFKVITDETWAKLMEASERGDKFTHCLPVMILRNTTPLEVPPVFNTEEEVVAVKKHLEIE